MIDLPAGLRDRFETIVYLGNFSTLPRTFWWAWELLDHRVEMNPLWMHDDSRRTVTAQVSSAFHFHYGVAGQALLEFRKFRFILEPGQAFLVAGSEPFAIGPLADSPGGIWENLGVMVSGGCLIELAREIMEWHGPVFGLHDAHPAIACLTRLLRGAGAGEYRDAITLCQAYDSLLLTLCQDATLSPTTASIPVTAVIDYMRSHYHHPLTVQFLADYASYSVSQLTRHFRTHTGLTPMEYLTRLRLTFAIEALIGQPELTAARVARASGLGHPVTLHKVTRRYLHCSPSVARSLVWNDVIRLIWPEPPQWLAQQGSARLERQRAQ